jgi:hypothetical protein
MSAEGGKNGLLGQGTIPADFLKLASRWCRDQSAILLGFVWGAYDRINRDSPALDERDLERSITQLSEVRIRYEMSGDEPFYIQHGPYERETMRPPPAQPPQYDLAFVLRADERIMWPLEAKVLQTGKAISPYVADIRQQFLTCRYAPFSSQGAMIGYLLTGSPSEAFDNIAAQVPCALKQHPGFPSRPHRISRHSRTVPAGKSYPAGFCCHHLIWEFFGLKRRGA